MRIISGKFRTRLIKTPCNNSIRPTSDRAREMIFNTLNSLLIKDKKKITGQSILDFFCGTGALGIEAVSRGADQVIFFDSSNESLNLCRKNCEELKIIEKIKIVKLDIFNDKFPKFKGKFDLFFCDPPYQIYSMKLIMEKINFLMKKDSYGVLELGEKKTDLNFDSFEVIKTKRVSRSRFIFVKKI
tara:strand:+ start:848 stop:1405 length:558 start_codon:yes stop_codon:yes gene_type:complete